MSNSPILIKKILQEELFKYNTEITKTLNVILSKFKEIDSRFEQIDGRFEKVDTRFETMATKTDLLEFKVDLMDELKFIREELGANSSMDIRQNEQLENHEKRIDKVEAHLNLATA